MAHLRVHGLNELSETLTERRLNRVGTFLVEGQVAGTWRFEAGSVVVKPFGPLGREARRDVDEEASHLAAFQAG